MVFFGKDIFKRVISICKRRMGVCFLMKEMFSELLKRHRRIEEKGGATGRGGSGSRDRKREGLDAC